MCKSFYVNEKFFNTLVVFYNFLFDHCQLKNRSKVMGFAGLNGINLQISSIRGNGTLYPTSLIAAFVKRSKSNYLPYY